MILLENAIKSMINMPEKDWKLFSECFEQKTLKKGEYFASEGKIETEIGFLEKGIIRAFYRTQDGVEYNKTFFISGDFFGAYASLVRRKPNRINIQTLTDVSYYKANYSAITALYEECRSVETLARLIAEEIYIQKENREIELALLQADERYQLFKAEYPGVENLIPQYHIASYLGITPTQLSRIRAKR
ncbi:MAG: Crp/Fnr family transcriptional regulator [Bacteroidia bacterium]|jgi:CRP-like cAMP-binding protein|nr:Crp/Fnr family transcriptional regulator [Bacteroidia bacterium]